MGRRIPHPALVNPHRWGVVRRFILKRDGYRCRACGKAGRLEVDHIVPGQARWRLVGRIGPASALQELSFFQESTRAGDA